MQAERRWKDYLTPAKIAGMVVGLLGTICILIACIVEWNMVTSLCALVGGTLGWLTGILAAPLSKVEEERFGVLAKVISGFVTGYLLSKIDPLINELLAVDHGAALIGERDVAVRALLAVASFFIAVLIVFNARIYWSAPDKDESITAQERQSPDSPPP